MKPQIKARGCDNVLRGQSYRKPQGVVIGMNQWWSGD
jgi:hypothetical protein